jgi:hypothetical protein
VLRSILIGKESEIHKSSSIKELSQFILYVAYVRVASLCGSLVLWEAHSMLGVEMGTLSFVNCVKLDKPLPFSSR